MWIAEYFTQKFVMAYNLLKVKDKRTNIFNKLCDKFIKLKIETFYLKVKTILLVEQDTDREAIIKLFKSVMTAKCKIIDIENDKHKMQ